MALDKLTGQENDLNNRINTLRNEVTLTPAEMQQKNNFQVLYCMSMSAFS